MTRFLALLWDRVRGRDRATDEETLETEPLLQATNKSNNNGMRRETAAWQDIQLLGRILKSQPRQFDIPALLGLVLAASIAKRFLLVSISLQEGALIGVLTGVVHDKTIDGTSVHWLFTVYCGLHILDSVSELAETTSMVPLRQYVERQVALYAHKHFLGLDLQFHVSQESGTTQKCIELSHTVPEVLEYLFIDCVPQIIDLITACVYASMMFGYKVAVTTTTTCLINIALSRSIPIFVRPYQQRYNDLWYQNHGNLVESATHWMTIAQSDRIKAECDRYTGSTLEMQKQERDFLFVWQILDQFFQWLLLAGKLTAFGFAIYTVSQRAGSVGDLVTLLALLTRSNERISQVCKALRKIFRIRTDLDRLMDMLKTTPEIQDKPEAKAFRVTHGGVVFEDVSFSYSGKTVLDNIGFEIQPGQLIGIVGASGEGKSTILRLLGRFCNLQSGSIYVDGQDISEIKLSDLRGSLVWLSQNESLFNRSIRENVTYINPTARQEEIDDACKSAAMYDRIQDFPDKYEARIGPDGQQLSGGERQRLALSRLLLAAAAAAQAKDERIFMLDEWSSALDSRTERTVQSALNSALAGKTRIMIAHRLSTIAHADMILVMDKNRIAERGPHDELLRKGGLYSDLWHAQTTVARSDVH